jgi:hypothetical protein
MINGMYLRTMPWTIFILDNIIIYDTMPAAGVAYDGSVWVTAVSSVALGE